MKGSLVLILLFILVCVGTVFGQTRPEIALTVNERFLDAALESVFAKGEPPSVALRAQAADTECKESITLLREINGVKSTVRFRDGRIVVPLAFRGSYRPPFIGCVDFSGTAEAVVEPEFDAQRQRVVAKSRLTNVSLTGSGGVGSSLLARLMQTSVDQKVNPIELIRLERLSFLFPIQSTGSLRLNAVGFRYTVQNGSITFFIPYEFVRL